MFELINLRPPSHTVGHYSSLDEARRVVIDRKLRHWAIWRGDVLVESACTSFIPGIDDKEAA